MSFVLLLTLLLLLGVDRLLAVTLRDRLPWYLSPSIWLLLPWILAALIYSLPIIVHRETLTLAHVACINICLFAYCIGASFKYFSVFKPKQISENPPYVFPSRLVLFLLAILGLIGSMLTLYDNLVVSGISLLDRFSGTGLNAARESNFAAQIQQVQGPFHLLEPLSGLGLLFLLCYMYMRFSGNLPKEHARLYFWMVIITILSIAVNSLLVSGGRMALVLLTVMLGQAILLDKHKTVLGWLRSKGQFARLSLILLASVLLSAAVIFLGTVYVQKRAGQQQSPILSLYLTHRADVESWAYTASKDMPLVGYGLFTLSYVTAPLATLSVYLDLPSQRMPGPFYGQYNFPGIADRIVKRIDQDSLRLWWDARLEVFQPLTRDGYGGNVWSTLLRDLAADVGRPLVPFVMLLLGYFTSAMTRRAYRSGNPFAVAVACAALCVTSFSIFHSVLYISIITSLLFFGGFAWFWGAWRSGYENKGMNGFMARRRDLA